MTQRYLSIHEAAQYIGCSDESLRQRVHRGNIPFIRDGRRIRFDREDLDRYMAARRVARRREAAADHEGSKETAHRS